MIGILRGAEKISRATQNGAPFKTNELFTSGSFHFRTAVNCGQLNHGKGGTTVYEKIADLFMYIKTEMT